MTHNLIIFSTLEQSAAALVDHQTGAGERSANSRERSGCVVGLFA
jgi:hypothetical protein